MFKELQILLNGFVSCLFCYYQLQQVIKQHSIKGTFLSSQQVLASLIVLLSPLLHILTNHYESYCYRNHCAPPHHLAEQYDYVQRDYTFGSIREIATQKDYKLQCEVCEKCLVPKYIRMKHCFRCGKCVHKYDHHCVLLNVCIGQFNQKFYILFLWSHLYNTLLILSYLLTWLKDQVRINQNGIQELTVTYNFQALFIIFLSLDLILTLYLNIIHFKFLLNGSTTYEKEKRDSVPYFKHLKKYNYLYLNHKGKFLEEEELGHFHPFDYGVLKNILSVLRADSSKPTDWKLNLGIQKNKSGNHQEEKGKPKTRPLLHFQGSKQMWKSSRGNELSFDRSLDELNLQAETTKSRQSFTMGEKGQAFSDFEIQRGL